VKKVIPIKIAQVADVHQGANYPGPFPLARFEDIDYNLDFIANKLIAEKVDLVLLCGDLFKDAKVMLDRANKEIASIVKFLRKLSDAGIETIAISGTPSHDAIPAYDLVREMQIPDVDIYTKAVIAQPKAGEATIACLPGLNRSSLLTQEEYKGLPPEQVHHIMTDKITQLCVGMSAQMPDYKPKILMAHMTYQGADTGFTDLLMQNEPILTKEAVAGFDLVCLGHIHRPQIIDNKVYYSGPIERLSFSDENIEPGFWIHEVDADISVEDLEEYMKKSAGKAGRIIVKNISDHPLAHAHAEYTQITSDFIVTPARKYTTLVWDAEMTKCYVDGVGFWGQYDDIAGAVVRLKYHCDEDTARRINRKALENAIYDGGAFFVQEIKSEIEHSDRARDNTVNETLTPLQALEKWAVNQQIEEGEIRELVSMASGMMEG
jgi:exonuclease SbcD